MYGLSLTTAPASEPVTTAEAKLHARVSTSADDTLIGNLITAARRYAEMFCSRSFINTTWKLTLDRWPMGKVIRVPRNPLSSVSSIKYYDYASVQQTLSSSLYRVDTTTDPGRIEPVFGQIWPVSLPEVNAIEVNFIAGYGATASYVPEEIKLAIKMIAAHWYERREAFELVQGGVLAEVPFAAQAILTSTWCGEYT